MQQSAENLPQTPGSTAVATASTPAEATTAPASTVAQTSGRAIAPYPPVQLDPPPYDERPGRMVLLHGLLVFPHLFALAFLNLVGGLGLFVAWWAVTFTRRYPRGIFNFLVGVEAWQMRASTYQWGITRAYPPFTTDEHADYPLRCEIAYPEQGIARWRPLMQPIIIWPRTVFVGIAIGLRVMVRYYLALWSVLLTGRYPRASYETAVRAMRWQQRIWAYRNFITDRYPPTYAQT